MIISTQEKLVVFPTNHPSIKQQTGVPTKTHPLDSFTSIKLVRTKCVRTHVVRAGADVVATKLGIIFIFLLSFSSFHALTFLPEGVCLGS